METGTSLLAAALRIGFDFFLKEDAIMPSKILIIDGLSFDSVNDVMQHQVREETVSQDETGQHVPTGSSMGTPGPDPWIQLLCATLNPRHFICPGGCLGCDNLIGTTPCVWARSQANI